MDVERSLATGYFPQEIPVSFSSESFAKARPGLTPHPIGKWTSPARFSLARAGGLRRSTEIPNPFAQAALVDLCSTHWATLQARTRLSPISMSRPVKRRGDRSMAYLCALASRPEAMIQRMPGGAVTLRTDISQFYPSIYTHAVDWAVRGKAVAKKTMRATTLGPSLDKRLQASRSGQTVGISIGPDTSWLVSEIVLARVDEALCKKHAGVGRRAVRFGDDMTFYASSEGEAHDVLSDYERILAEYELALNPIKVEVLRGIEPPEPRWVTTLRQARYRDANDAGLTHDLIDLFTLAFDAARDHPTQGVLSYAIKRCDPFPGGARSWPVYRDLVLATMTQEPSTFRHVYQVLRYARDRKLAVNTDRVVEVLNELCAQHARFDHGFEVSWILTILRELDLPLDLSAAKVVAEMEDNVSLVLLLDMMRSSVTLGSAVDVNQAIQRAEVKGALSTSDWLLAYELRASKWCTPKAWDNIDCWKELNRAKVRFLLPSNETTRLPMRRRRPAFLPRWSYP